jgi:ryanodine receptor 2
MVIIVCLHSILIMIFNYRPLFKVLDKLLLVGTMNESDVERLLIMIHPQTWDPTFDRAGKDEHSKGIINMKIHEGVKLQMCKLLHHLCDVQLRHRVEYSIAFSQGYMKVIQQDQLRRYVEIKQSDMPSAVAAKKTKEFRCPPREQMNTILCFKNMEGEDLEDCACIPSLREKMEEFHGSLMQVMAISSIEEEDVEPVAVDTSRPSVFAVIMKALKDKAEEVTDEFRLKSPEEKFRKVLVETIIAWGCESEIENTELVREMFNLLLRQYDTVGELMRATETTYVIDAKTKPDAVEMWVALSRIRSLLPVQMSKEEEELVREYLWYNAIKSKNV